MGSSSAFGVELLRREGDRVLLRTPYGPVVASLSRTPAPGIGSGVTLHSGGTGAYPGPHPVSWGGELLPPLECRGRRLQIEPKVYAIQHLPRHRDVEPPLRMESLPPELALVLRVAYDLAVDLLAPCPELPAKRVSAAQEELGRAQAALLARRVVLEGASYLLVRGTRVNVLADPASFEAAERVAVLNLTRLTDPRLARPDAQLLTLALLEHWEDTAEELLDTVRDVLGGAAALPSSTLPG